MKGLRKIIFPFAPDQSGAASVFYDLGGMIVICDAGGCAGNICGFDEPRWFGEKSAVFSAGLRDMDAILGRDEQMVEKMADVCRKLSVSFAAVIGTPVPATIATDYQALRRMAEKKCGVPVLTVDTNGTRWYDHGAEKAYLELMQTFAEEADPADMTEGSIGVLGATPIDLGDLSAAQKIRGELESRGASKVICYGAGATLDEVKQAGRVQYNLVVSPSGLKTAEYLKKRFGTPYKTGYPVEETVLRETGYSELEGKRILIIHQQVRANALRDQILRKAHADVDIATWFMLKAELKMPQDVQIKEEDQFVRLVQDGNYDVIFGDPAFYKAIRKFYRGKYIDYPHFAVSGARSTSHSAII